MKQPNPIRPVDARPLVVFVAPYFPPAYYGGVVQIYLGLLERLTAFRVVVVTDRYHSSPSDQNAWDSLAPARYPFRVARLDAFEFHLPAGPSRALPLPLLTSVIEMTAFLLRGRRQWKALLSELRPDVVVCGGTYSAGWLMRQVPRSVPLVNYVHGEELTMQLTPRLLMKQMRRYQMQSLRTAKLNIAVSQYSAEMIEKLSGAEKSTIKLLPNFVDTHRFRRKGERETLRRKLGWEGKLVVFTLARLEKRKGIDQALRALCKLKCEGKLPYNCVYTVGGRGCEGETLRLLAAELGLLDRVRFLGFVQESDVAGMYEAADIFLQPNREIDGDTEGFGVVFLEASACGVPVIGGTAGGTADAIAEGISGLRVNGDSVVEIATALERLIEDPDLRRRMGAEGARRVATLFNVERAAREFEVMLFEALTHAGER